MPTTSKSARFKDAPWVSVALEDRRVGVAQDDVQDEVAFRGVRGDDLTLITGSGSVAVQGPDLRVPVP